MIEVKDLRKIYTLGEIEVPALNGVTIRINDGEMISMMGKSGSGKSTFLRQVGLLDSPTEGTVIIDGEDTSTLSAHSKTTLRLQHLGYVFQEYALLPELNAFNNVYLPGMMNGEQGVDYKSRTSELLDRVGLKDRMDHLPKELSGGEQQRVAIARSLINKPKYLFADEPCANLDTISAATVMETLVGLNKDLGVTILFVSHDPEDKKYAERQIFLRDGRVVEPYF